jgi:Fur family peroxide stress response transcriptional regulator
VRAKDHPDAEKVFKKLRKQMPTLSLDTVYRTLWVLNDLGVITTLGSSRERARFEGNLEHHHHFICTRCGLTSDFYSDELNALRVPDSLTEIGDVEQTHVEVRGTCKKCLKNVSKQIRSDKSTKQRSRK